MESLTNIDKERFISDLKTYVLNGNKEALWTIIDDENVKKSLKVDSLDLIKIICQLLIENRSERKEHFVECCEIVIWTVAENGHPEEILLELIEQAEYLDDEVFLTLVLPMQKVLLMIPEKQSQSLEWVLNTIHRFIYSLPLPEDQHFEEQELVLLEADDTVVRIRHIYKEVLNFYTPFIEKAIEVTIPSENNKLKHLLLQSLTHLLGKPVLGLDLTARKPEPLFRYYVEKIISWIVSLSDDILIYLMCVENQNMDDFNIYRDKDDHFVNSDLTFFDFLFCDKFPNDALGVFYYMVFCENIESKRLPCVYNAEFIFENCIYFSLTLIESSHSLAQFKGLFLAESLALRINDNSIRYEALNSPIHKKYFEILSKHSIYNEIETIRKISLKVISLCFKIYDYKSQYIILFNLERSISHPGFLGYLITFIKDIVVSMLNSQLSLYNSHFSGKSLYDLMKKYCKLPDGTESDLVDVADSVISSLNLIRFLVLRDNENVSGIWDYVPELELLLFTPLRKGLVLSRTHYELKLKEIKDGGRKSTESTNMTVTVGKEQLGHMSKEEQVMVIHSALNAFDLIESILSRVNECISLRNNQNTCIN